MINPFRSEADAFRLLIGAVVYLGAIGIAALAGGFWVGLIVFIVLTLAHRRLVGAGASAERPPQSVRAHMPEGSAGSSSSRTRRSAARSCGA